MAIKTEKAYYRVYWRDGSGDWNFEAAFVKEEDAVAWHNFSTGSLPPELIDPYRIMCKGKIVKEWDTE